MSGPLRVGARVAGVIGTEVLDAIEVRIASLEVAVAENAALEVPLARMVDDLARAVAGVVERTADGEVGR